jgi:hypothetical protein
MHPSDLNRAALLTRRHFLGNAALGLGGVALAELLGQSALGALTQPRSPLAPRPAHF